MVEGRRLLSDDDGHFVRLRGRAAGGEDLRDPGRKRGAFHRLPRGLGLLLDERLARGLGLRGGLGAAVSGDAGRGTTFGASA